MSKLLFIDSDDINALSEALKDALERRGVIFKGDRYGEFDYPTSDDEEPDIDPYMGVMPSYGGCGGSGNRSASCGYGGCGSHISSCGVHYGSCGDNYFYPRC